MLVISGPTKYFRARCCQVSSLNSFRHMKKIEILTLGLFFCYLCSLGCKDTKQVIIGPTPPRINSAINLTSFENLDPVARTFEFHCLTDSLYSCSNFSIDFLLSVSADTFDLTFTELSAPLICLPSEGKAYSVVHLGDLANNTYQFLITVNNVTVPVQLIVTDSTIETIGGDSTWTNLLRPVLRRIPANTIWGQVGFDLIAALDSAKTFFDSLISIGAIPETLSTGSYGYFYFDGTGNPDSIKELSASIGTTYRIPYVYSYSGDTAALHSLINAYSNQGNVVEVNVITSEGYEYKSW